MPRERRENLGVGRTVPAQYSRQEDERAAAEAFNQALTSSGAADPHPSAPVRRRQRSAFQEIMHISIMNIGQEFKYMRRFI